MNTITIITSAVAALMSGYTVWLVNLKKLRLTTLHGIVMAAAAAAMTGIISGFLIGILSEDVFLACGAGMIIGFVFGFLVGQPIGMMPILGGSSIGFIGGAIGAILGVAIKAENSLLFLIILLVFYIIVLGLIILFIHVEADENLTLDTLAISPFVIISAGIVLLSAFLFLYGSDLIKDSSITITAQTQAKSTETSSGAGSPTAATVEVDVTKEKDPKIKMEVTPTGYSPNVIRVKKGTAVEIDVHNPLENSCLSTLNMPDFNINNVNLKVGTTTLTFTPSNSGEYTFSCGMNMYKGKIIVE